MRSSRLGAGLGALLSLVALVAPWAAVPPPALAHTPVGSILVIRPDFEEILEAPLRIVLEAAGDPGSDPSVVVSLSIDGDPVDAETGAIVAQPVPPFTMEPGERREVVVAKIDPGTHDLAIEVSPSETEVRESAEVPFVIQQLPDEGGAAGAIASVVITVILVGALVLAYWRLRPRGTRAER